jgi:hypothetical protein
LVFGEVRRVQYTVQSSYLALMSRNEQLAVDEG